MEIASSPCSCQQVSSREAQCDSHARIWKLNGVNFARCMAEMALLSSALTLSLSPSALIAGGAVGLLFAVFLVLLLVYRMKKKDEGSYDLGKKPIYKKAPTNEFYA